MYGETELTDRMLRSISTPGSNQPDPPRNMALHAVLRLVLVSCDDGDGGAGDGTQGRAQALWVL